MFLRTVAAGQRRRKSMTGADSGRRSSLLPDLNRRKSSFGVSALKIDRSLSATEERYLRVDCETFGKFWPLQHIPESLTPKHQVSGSLDENNKHSNVSLLYLSDSKVSRKMLSITQVQANEQRLTFKIKGQLYETFESTLRKFPNTLLGNKLTRERFFDSSSNCYVINRCQHSFGAVLFYYQSEGILSRPLDVNREEFLEEMKFYEIDEYLDARHRQEKIFLEKEQKNRISPQGKYRNFIWKILEYQEKNCVSTVCFHFYLFTSVMAIVIFCAETEPKFKSLTFWDPLETIVNILFTLEYVLRVYSAPCIKGFMFSAFGLVDLFAVVPFYSNAIIKLAGNEAVASLSILTLLRVLRVFKLTRFNEGLRILMMTIYESLSHLRSLFVCIGITSLFFATVLFYIESDQLNISPTNNFKSIPDSFWYTVITATAVGYGDMYPKTSLGKFVGSLLASVGLLLFCLPTPMLVNKFVECYYIRMTLTNIVDPHRKAVIKRMRETFME